MRYTFVTSALPFMGSFFANFASAKQIRFQSMGRRVLRNQHDAKENAADVAWIWRHPNAKENGDEFKRNVADERRLKHG